MNCGRCKIETSTELCKVCTPFGPSTTSLPTNVPDNAVSLGADPELLFLDGGNEDRIIPATRIVQDSQTATLGTDGNSTVAELRPKPAKHVYELAETVKKLLTRAKARTRKMPHVKMLAGHGKSHTPIGGHIHFGVRPSNDLIKALDLASLYLMAYDDTPTARLRRNSYGQLGCIENKPYGFEYRTPQSWLSHPELMKETVALYHAIALECKTNVEGFRKWVATYEQIKSVLGSEEPTSSIPEWVHTPEDVLKAHWKYNHKGTFKKFVPQITGLITDLTAMRLNWNGYRPLLHQLLKNAWHKKKYSPIIDIKAWNIHLKERAKLVPLIVFKESDGHFQELGPKCKARLVSDAGLVVFGLKTSRDCDIGIHAGLPDLVRAQVLFVAEKFGWKTQTLEGIPWGVGIHSNLRKEHQDCVVEFINVLQDELVKIPDLQKLLSVEHNPAYRHSRFEPRNKLGLEFGIDGDSDDLVQRFNRALQSQFETTENADDYDGEELEPDYGNDEQES